LIAKRPGGSSEPEIIAASVSRIMCLVFSTTSAGSAWPAASLMKVLSLVMIGLTAAGFVWARAALAVNSPPAAYRISRRVRSFFIGPPVPIYRISV
jgi:hypothetical protein